jgi:L-cysteine S-thiosulfotransferase
MSVYINASALHAAMLVRTVGEPMKFLLGGGLAALALAVAAQSTPYQVDGDGINKPLTATAGNAARGKALIVARGPANCLDCHSVAKDKLRGGDRGPALDGVGAALTTAQLRLTVADFARISPKAEMPSFHRDASKAGSEPVLSAQQVEDIVAYLGTLK